MVLLLACGMAAYGQSGDSPIELDHPAIAYRTQPRTDAVTMLQRRLRSGEVRLQFETRAGYLRSLLAALDVPIESQVAVFSTTSLQGRLIRPANPRTIFFNDSVAVAWMEGGFIELAAHDPRQGTSFYTLAQQRAPAPELLRQDNCLSCHYSVGAGGVPGFFLRSIPTAVDGAPLPWLGNYTTDHRSPIEERWGGWYVTGDAGSRRHLGNLLLDDRRAQDLPRWTSSRALQTLASHIDDEKYLSPHSDIVALLVLDHQTRMMNLMTRLGRLTRIAAHEGRPAETVSEAAADLVDDMLFVEEAPLDRVRGSSGFGFAERFAARGPRDAKGRSLRDLDLRSRLMRYPCSYLIYSEAFDALPADARTLVYRRLKAVLTGEDRAPKYARLSAGDRQSIVEILKATKRDLPAWF